MCVPVFVYYMSCLIKLESLRSFFNNTFIIQGKQGEIKHVYRGSVFIQSCTLVENGGLIVAKARHVELAGGTGAVSCSVMYYSHAYILYTVISEGFNDYLS